ncbi:MAG: serine hydrolase domain-containing protein [Candidatus Kapaibacteriota bacterium]|jgi:CubicO group peptidase (beta-lactamase class C family)
MLFLHSLPVSAQQNIPEAHHYDFSRVDKLLHDSLGRFDDGCALIIMQDGKVLYEKGFGTVGVESVMPIASASKWLSGALLLTLVDEHKIALSDSIGKYLQYLSGAKATITVRQLFSHTSGFAGEIAVMRDMKLSMKNAVYAICQEPLKYKPGTAFAYGGASMQIGGRIAELVGGKSWEQLFQDRIAKPLGMANTSFYGLGVTDNPLVAGGAKSSAREYMRFLQMISNKGMWQGRRILSEAACLEMMKNHAAGTNVLKQYQQNSATTDSIKEKADYGIGVWRVCAENNAPFTQMLLSQVMPLHNLLELSSQGRNGFTPWYDMKRNIVGVLATKTPLRKMNPTYRALKRLLREIVPLPQVIAVSPNPPAATTSATTTHTVRKR